MVRASPVAALRFDLFPLAILLVLSASLELVARVFVPRLFRPERSVWPVRAALFAIALATLSVELLARARAPIGGGHWRHVISIERSLVIAIWGSATLVTLARFTVELIGRVRLHRRRARSLARAEHESTIEPHPGASAETQAILPANSLTESRTSEPPDERDEHDNHPESTTRRDAIARAAQVAVVAATHSYVGYGLLKGRSDLRVREVVVRIAKLPRALEGYTIAQLTDVHYGMFTGFDDMRPIIEKTLAIRADMIVITGDLIDRQPRHIADAMRSLHGLRAPDGVYSILGNHDYYTGFDKILAALARTHIRSLVNERLVIRPQDQGGFVLGGLDDEWAPRVVPGRFPDVRATFEGSDPERARVLLAHNPRAFHRSKDAVDLQLSGHTHGGQINPGGLMSIPLEYVSGLYRAGDSQLFVSNGLGFTGPPVRLSAPPEIAKIVLVR